MIGYDPETHYTRIGDTTQLFLDNSMVHWVKNIKRTHHKAVPHEDNPVIRKDRPWEEMPYFTTCYSVIRDDDGTFKAWYSDFLVNPDHKRPVPYLNPPWWDSRLCYATSEDGIHFEKPLLGQVEIGGRDTNVVRWNEHMDVGVAYSVIRDPVETDPAKRFKMSYLPIKFSGNLPKMATTGSPDLMGLAVAFSGDGVNWDPHPDNPVETVWGSDVQNLMYDHDRGRYVIYGRAHSAGGGGSPNSDGWFARSFPDLPYGWVPKRSVYILESEDMVNWTPAKRVLAPGPHHNLDEEFYGLAPFRLGGYYGGLLPVLHAVDNTMDPEFVYSKDGVNWVHTPQAGRLIERREGSWDDIMITSAEPPIRVGDELYIYYGGSPSHHDWWIVGEAQGLDTHEGAQGYPVNHGMGLATIRADGFVSLDAGLREGVVNTKPFFSAGARLIVNARCGRNGYVKAEIQDTAENSWPGFGADECDVFTGDDVNHVFSWKGGSAINMIPGYVRVSFVLKDAELYSFRVADEV